MEEKAYYKELGRQIRIFRKMNGLTQKDLAEKIQKSLPCVSKYERGDITIDLFTLQKIADLLHIPVEEFLPNTDARDDHSYDEESYPPLFRHKTIYFYWYHTRKTPLTKHAMEIDLKTKKVMCYMDIDNPLEYKDSCEYIMRGKIKKMGPNVYISVTNAILPDDPLLICVNQVDLFSNSTIGFLSCLNRSYHMVASKCFLTSSPSISQETILQAISATKGELYELKQTNFYSFGSYTYSED